jgi:hypothetical protein
MKMLNRFALVVRPSVPFIEWASGVGGEPMSKVIQDLGQEPTIYLIPESRACELTDTVLKPHWRTIFTEALEGWSTDKKVWPKSISLPMFREWFRVDFVTILMDRGKDPLRLE